MLDKDEWDLKRLEQVIAKDKERVEQYYGRKLPEMTPEDWAKLREFGEWMEEQRRKRREQRSGMDQEGK